MTWLAIRKIQIQDFRIHVSQLRIFNSLKFLLSYILSLIIFFLVYITVFFSSDITLINFTRYFSGRVQRRIIPCFFLFVNLHLPFFIIRLIPILRIFNRSDIISIALMISGIK